ncbi:hypothetical protein ACS0TY_005463 [Phlomoides rotata]
MRVGQIANIIGGQHKQWQFPSNTELSSKEQGKVNKLRSGTSYEGPKMPSEDGQEEKPEKVEGEVVQ